MKKEINEKIRNKEITPEDAKSKWCGMFTICGCQYYILSIYNVCDRCSYCENCGLKIDKIE